MSYEEAIVFHWYESASLNENKAISEERKKKRKEKMSVFIVKTAYYFAITWNCIRHW